MTRVSEDGRQHPDLHDLPTPEWAEHLRTCEECAARVEAERTRSIT